MNIHSSSEPRIALIAAVAPDLAIGKDNSLPWRLPRDLRYFRRITTGHVVIMGRRTFDSFGKRTLPNRKNIVVSRTLQNATTDAFVVARSLAEAVTLAKQMSRQDRIFVIGGGDIYNQALASADEIFLSVLEQDNPTYHLFSPPFAGDTFFPCIDEAEWDLCHLGRRFIAQVTLRGPTPKTPGTYFRTIKLVRKSIGCTGTEIRKLRTKNELTAPQHDLSILSHRHSYFNDWLATFLLNIRSRRSSNFTTFE